MYNLIVDDERTPPQIYKMMNFDKRYLSKNMFVVKSVYHFYDILRTKGCPQFISFDHDLSLRKYNFIIGNQKFEDIDDTGMSCAKLLIAFHMTSPKIKFPEFTVHSQNPVGKENINSILRSYIKIMRKL